MKEFRSEGGRSLEPINNFVIISPSYRKVINANNKMIEKKPQYISRSEGKEEKVKIFQSNFQHSKWGILMKYTLQLMKK